MVGETFSGAALFAALWGLGEGIVLTAEEPTKKSRKQSKIKQLL